MVKTILLIIAAIIITLILGVVFLLLGMNIGGNYFTDLELFGARGYEATANLGFLLGIFLGLLLSYIFLPKLLKK